MSRAMTWEDPPSSGRHDWGVVAQRLRENPNQWLKVDTDAPIAVVNALRQDSIRAIHPVKRQRDAHAGFEVRTRNNQAGPPRTADIYIRWYEPE